MNRTPPILGRLYVFAFGVTCSQDDVNDNFNRI